MIILNNNVQTPIYIQIYEQLRDEIIRGELHEVQKLVSTRYLAESLAVGRNTVEKAYLQLSSEGYVESRVGKRIFMCRTFIIYFPWVMTERMFEF